jgi:hypothetical protein
MSRRAPSQSRRTSRRSPDRRRIRRRRIVAAVVAGLLLVAVVVVAVVIAGGVLREETPEPVVLPTPTPTVPPAERAKVTAFQQALPDAVLAFVVAEQVEDDALLDAGAVEAYSLTYTDGSREVTLRAGQWPTVQEVAEAMEPLIATEPDDDVDAGGPGAAPSAPDGTEGPSAPATTGAATTVTPRDGPVLVGGSEVGRVVLWGDAASASAVWSNGLTLFSLTGPGDAVPALYDAFPM